MTTSGAVQSVDRAVQVLEAIAREDGASVAALARELSVHASTASRLVASLEHHDLVERDEDGTVQLGVGLLRLAASARPRRDLTAIAGPVCEALAEELGETVNVAVLRGGVAVNLYQAQARSTVAMHNWVGDRTVLHATASGKMLLAQLDPDRRRELLRGPLEAFTAHTLTDPGQLDRQLAAARERGWVEAIEEFEEGLVALAAPVRGPEGAVVAAVSAAGPAYRLSPQRLPEAAVVLRGATEEISRRLGHRESRRAADDAE
ncbi:IclR family transcriptional regulator [Brachybacterium saurashtrense]|uniref:IclR family transcriptional regulator n=1 Tax=Brachybacterium saurashtrense TaxID=556288 RepID=A0A345YND9_9MICO|nr:IclR family transcriptional regulator [Brachybacterium saurashtrense]AXK45441.1 IclR family transcriptional regulator [Brachybacterium saurashtrense]RRR21186.1 IclR family transcriptional regulator [Brachybacterium saurashtrense]